MDERTSPEHGIYAQEGFRLLHVGRADMQGCRMDVLLWWILGGVLWCLAMFVILVILRSRLAGSGDGGENGCSLP